MKPLTWDHPLFQAIACEGDAQDRLVARLQQIVATVRRGNYERAEAMLGLSVAYGRDLPALDDLLFACTNAQVSVTLHTNEVRAKQIAAEGRKQRKARR